CRATAWIVRMSLRTELRSMSSLDLFCVWSILFPHVAITQPDCSRNSHAERKAAPAKFDGWLATAHKWIPAGHLAAKNLAYPSPNWLLLSPRIVACALAQRQLEFKATQQKKTKYDTKC